MTLQLHVLTFSGQNPNKVPITGLLVQKYHQSINYKTMDEIRDEIYFFFQPPINILKVTNMTFIKHAISLKSL